MTMDFSQLHTYTPPQCAPDNTGYTYSLSSSYSTAALEFEKEHQIAPVYESPRMSRRSLRLQTSAGHYGNDSLAEYKQNHGSSSSTTNRRETRTLRSRKQSRSNFMLLSINEADTPKKALSFSASTPVNNIQENYIATDASLLTPIADQSPLRQRIITTTTTTATLARIPSADHTTSVNGDATASKTHTSLANGYTCTDCLFHSHRMESFTTHASSSSASQPAEATPNALSPSSVSRFTSIYSRDRSRKSKTGVLVSVSNTCLHFSKRALAPIVSFVTLLYSNMLWLGSLAKSSRRDGVHRSFLDSVRQTVSSSLSQLWLLKQTTLHKMMGYRANGYEKQAHSSVFRSTNVKELTILNGSLCDDCKGKQYSDTNAVLLKSSGPRRKAGVLWSLLACTGYCLLQPGYGVVRAGRALGSGVGTMTHMLLSLLWTILAAPVKAGRGLLWFLAKGWYQLVYLMSLLNVFFLTRCLPKLWKLLLLLLPFLLLLALWVWGPSTAALLAYLPAINLTEWRRASPLVLLSNLVPVSAPVPAAEPPATFPSQAPPIRAAVDLERLQNVERQLALLWERVQQSDQKQEQHHTDILGFYNTLREKLHTETDRESLGLWVSSLLEQKVSALRGELEQERTHRAQNAEQQKLHQESQTTRLVDLELLLTALAAKTEEVQQRQQRYEQEKEKMEEEVVTPASDLAPLGVGVKQEDHDALLAEVQRLELELGRVRQDLQGVVGCKGKCEQLDSLHETINAQVSSQVRKELQALFFGSGVSGEEHGEVPESLIHWLSQRYMSTPDLQAALASLELSILRNVSQQLELHRTQTLGEAESQAKAIVQTVAETVHSSASAEGLTEEQVKLVVQNALKLYSQDRTGLVDYALESGGGSILSTRCSETYETKTALMSLFGLPLWYFSQSPRVVIQPDVYPGNCWAFKGSQGYLVIRLSLRIMPTSFCMEHIPKALSPTGNITSAPQNFTVYGLNDEYQEEGEMLGRYTYQEDGDSLQTFPVQEQNNKAFQIIEVRVLSNWGHPEYTCLYRFRVHGDPRPQ